MRKKQVKLEMVAPWSILLRQGGDIFWTAASFHLLFADAHSWDNLSHWDTECHSKVCICKGTEWWLQPIVIVGASQFHECKTEEGSKVVVLLPFSVWFSPIHNQEIQQPLYLSIYIYIYSAFFLAAAVPGAWESQLSASGVSYMEDLFKENFHELLE